MFTALYNSLVEWNRNTSDREKLQHTYLTILFVSVVVAGLVSLVDPIAGQDLLVVTAIAAGIYLVNAVIWALLESVIFTRLTDKRKK
jgi:ABC-type transport system involved in cytochrome bd biosynthesis fused ATPase/permease subunit